MQDIRNLELKEIRLIIIKELNLANVNICYTSIEDIEYLESISGKLLHFDFQRFEYYYKIFGNLPYQLAHHIIDNISFPGGIYIYGSYYKCCAGEINKSSIRKYNDDRKLKENNYIKISGQNNLNYFAKVIKDNENYLRILCL